MKKGLFPLLAALVINSVVQADAIDPELFFVEQAMVIGSILFPKSVERIPMIPVFCAGNEARYEVDSTQGKITFSVLVNKRSITYYLLICDQVVAHMHEDSNFKNLVQYLKVSPGVSYRLYRVSLTYPKLSQKCSSHKQADERVWLIEEMMLGSEGALPDQTIIISCNPHWIGDFEIVSSAELPHLKIRSDLLEYLGGEEALHRYSDEQLLAMLDMKLIHAKIRPDFKKHEKTIVAMITR